MRFIWVFAGLGLAAAACAWAADGGAPMAAVWKEQHLRFSYMGRTSRYSCDGLRDKVRAMLLDMGARRDLTITALGCDPAAAQAGPGSPGPSLNIGFSSPALPDPNARPMHTDLAALHARFEAFTIGSDVFRNMSVADCELVEAFARQILPRLATRNVKQDITCVPYQQGGGRFLVRGEVLRSVPP
jgi:hypothetical protein